MKQFEQNVKKHKEEVRKNVCALLAELPAVYNKFIGIVGNKNQAPLEMRHKIEKLKKEKSKVHYPTLFASLSCMK